MTSTSATIRPAIRLGGGVAPLGPRTVSGGGGVTPEPTRGLGEEATATGSVAAAATVAAAGAASTAGPASTAVLSVVGERSAASTSVELAVELAADMSDTPDAGGSGSLGVTAGAADLAADSAAGSAAGSAALSSAATAGPVTALTSPAATAAAAAAPADTPVAAKAAAPTSPAPEERSSDTGTMWSKTRPTGSRRKSTGVAHSDAYEASRALRPLLTDWSTARPSASAP